MTFSFQALAGLDCKLLHDKAYFQDLEGDAYPDPSTGKLKVHFEKYDKFKPDYPIKAALRVPYTGDCSDTIIFKVEMFRAIGPWPKEGETSENDHSHHSINHVKIDWEKKPKFSGKMAVKVNKDHIEVSEFPINQYAEEAPKDKHIWKYKFVLKYQTSKAQTMTLEKVMEAPLVH